MKHLKRAFEEATLCLSEEELEKLKKIIRSRKIAKSVGDRARIVVWRSKGISISDIARRLGIDRQTVSLWLSRYSKDDPHCLYDKRRTTI